jgi:hypothetical protein
MSRTGACASRLALGYGPAHQWWQSVVELEGVGWQRQRENWRSDERRFRIEDKWEKTCDNQWRVAWDHCDLARSKLKKFQCTIYIIRKIVLSEIVFETRIWNFSMAFLAKWKQTRLAEPIARITQSRSFQGRLPSHRRSFHLLNSKQLLFSEILDTISHVPWRGLAREGVNPRICQYKFSPACGLINDVSVLSSVAGILP